jgi:hypothetical protein
MASANSLEKLTKSPYMIYQEKGYIVAQICNFSKQSSNNAHSKTNLMTLKTDHTFLKRRCNALTTSS